MRSSPPRTNRVQELRISCLIGSLQPGGGEGVFTKVVTWLAEQGAQVEVITTAGPAPTDLELPASVSRRCVESEDPRWFSVSAQLRRLREMRQLLLAQRPHVVLSFLTEMNVAALTALAASAVPVVISERIDIREHPVARRIAAWRRLTYARAATLVVQTDDLRDWIRTHRRRWHVTTIPNPVVAPVRQGGPSVAGVTPGRFVLAIGRLAPQKGFDVLLAAFASVADTFPDWQLVVVGSGPERGALVAALYELGLVERVVLAGRLDPPSWALRNAGVFALSSRYEGFPNALAEAMAHGLASVATDCPTGPRELILPGVNGLLVPVDDVAALAKALTALMEDENLRIRLGAAARDVVERFATDRIMRMWSDTLLAAAGPGA